MANLEWTIIYRDITSELAELNIDVKQKSIVKPTHIKMAIEL